MTRQRRRVLPRPRPGRPRRRARSAEALQPPTGCCTSSSTTPASPPAEQTADGLSWPFGTNHVGRFSSTCCSTASPPPPSGQFARIVNVASGNRFHEGAIDWGAVRHPHVRGPARYDVSQAGERLLHPGARPPPRPRPGRHLRHQPPARSPTDVWRRMPARSTPCSKLRGLKTPDEGAGRPSRAATDPTLDDRSGAYVDEDGTVIPPAPSPRPSSPPSSGPAARRGSPTLTNPRAHEGGSGRCSYWWRRAWWASGRERRRRRAGAGPGRTGGHRLGHGERRRRPHLRDPHERRCTAGARTPTGSSATAAPTRTSRPRCRSAGDELVEGERRDLPHLCGRTNGRLFCWGRDHVEQLGDGFGTTDQTTPCGSAPRRTGCAVDAGGAHTWTPHHPDGRLFCWEATPQAVWATIRRAATAVASGGRRRRHGLGVVRRRRSSTAAPSRSTGQLVLLGRRQLPAARRRERPGRPVGPRCAGTNRARWTSVAVGDFYPHNDQDQRPPSTAGERRLQPARRGAPAGLRRRPVRIGSASDWTVVAAGLVHTTPGTPPRAPLLGQRRHRPGRQRRGHHRAAGARRGRQGPPPTGGNLAVGRLTLRPPHDRRPVLLGASTTAASSATAAPTRTRWSRSRSERTGTPPAPRGVRGSRQTPSVGCAAGHVDERLRGGKARGHDASDFYARFTAPDISADDEVLIQPEVDRIWRATRAT